MALPINDNGGNTGTGTTPTPAPGAPVTPIWKQPRFLYFVLFLAGLYILGLLINLF